MVLFGQKCCIRAKLLYSGKSGSSRGRWLYSCKRGSNRAKAVVFGQKLLY